MVKDLFTEGCSGLLMGHHDQTTEVHDDDNPMSVRAHNESVVVCRGPSKFVVFLFGFPLKPT